MTEPEPNDPPAEQSRSAIPSGGIDAPPLQRLGWAWHGGETTIREMPDPVPEAPALETPAPAGAPDVEEALALGDAGAQDEASAPVEAAAQNPAAPMSPAPEPQVVDSAAGHPDPVAITVPPPRPPWAW